MTGRWRTGLALSLRRFLAFPLLFRAISTGLVGSTFESVSVVSGDCEDRSKRSISKGLFRTLEAVGHIMKSISDILDGY